MARSRLLEDSLVVAAVEMLDQAFLVADRRQRQEFLGLVRLIEIFNLCKYLLRVIMSRELLP